MSDIEPMSEDESNVLHQDDNFYESNQKYKEQTNFKKSQIEIPHHSTEYFSTTYVSKNAQSPKNAPQEPDNDDFLGDDLFANDYLGLDESDKYFKRI